MSCGTQHNSSERPLREPANSLVVLPRQVLVRRVLGLLDRHGAVELLAGDGWGKSTLARAIAAKFDGEVTCIDCADLVDGGLGAVVKRMSAVAEPVLLVVDDAECLAGDESATAVLTGLTAAPPGGVAVLMCTTQPVGSTLDEAASDDESASGVAVLTASDLRFSMGEVTDLRARSAAASPLPATEVMRLTGGWPRGVRAVVQLDARNPRTLDLLEDAIEASVLTGLPADDREFLLHVSALDSLDLETAVAIFGEEARGCWERIEQHALPLVIFADRRLSFRRPLRSYLRSELVRGEPGANEQLRAAYVDHVRSNGRYVEAIDWYLGRGSRMKALKMIAEHASTEVDIATIEPVYDRWAKALGEDVLLADDATAGLVIRILDHRRQTEQAAVLAQQLIDDGRMGAMLEAAPSLRPVVVYVLHNRPKVALQLLPEGRGSYALGAVAYSVAVTGGTEPVEAPDRSEWGDLAIHVLWGLLWQGRLVDALDAVSDQGVLIESNASVVLAALWSDQPELAERAYQQMPKADGYPWAQFAEAAVALYRGDHDKGLRILSAAMPDAQRSQAAPTFETLASYLTLKAGDPDRAIKRLETRLPQHLASGRYAMAEWSQLILALGYLHRDRPIEATQVLEPAIATMEAAERLMLLGAARIAHAEARARTGADPTEVRHILDSASVMPANIGSSYWEREVRAQARELRRLGLVSEESDESGAAVAARLGGPIAKQVTPRPRDGATAVVAAGEPTGRLSAFEQPPVLDLDGVRHSLGRTKLAELIADLAVHGGVVDRAALQVRMFPDAGQRSAGNHFRQVLFKLRELTGVVLDRPSRNEIGWPATGELTSTDLEFEVRVRDLLAAAQTDVDSLRAALDVMTGPYLPASELSWVVERRQLLNLLFEEGVSRLLRHPASADDLDLVRAYGYRAVVLSPYSEDIYRLMIEAELERGSAARARAIYRRAVHAMLDLGLEPSGEIRVLARRLSERLKAEQAAEEVARRPAPSM
jgi:LuxR family maltose regulon positive regulatory protein